MGFSAEINPLEETLPLVFDGDVVLDPTGVYWQILGKRPEQKRLRLAGLPAGYPTDRVVRFDTSPYFGSLPIVEQTPSAPLSPDAVLAQVAQLLNVPIFPPTEPSAPRLRPEHEAWFEALRKALNLAWDKALQVMAEDSPERREALLRRFTAQRKEETDELVKRWEPHIAVAKVLQAIPVAAIAGLVYEVVVRLMQLLTKVVGSAMGPEPQDATLEAVSRWSYRGFCGYFWLKEQGIFGLAGTSEQAEIRKWEFVQRWVDHVDATLKSYESGLGVDLRVAFPARSADYSGAELLKLREVAQSRPWEAVRFRLDTHAPLYLLEALPAPEKLGKSPVGQTSGKEATRPGAEAVPPVGGPPQPQAPSTGAAPLVVGLGLVLALAVIYWRRRTAPALASV